MTLSYSPGDSGECLDHASADRAAIGHVRYATCGANDLSYASRSKRPHGCK